MAILTIVIILWFIYALELSWAYIVIKLLAGVFVILYCYLAFLQSCWFILWSYWWFSNLAGVFAILLIFHYLCWFLSIFAEKVTKFAARKINPFLFFASAEGASKKILVTSWFVLVCDESEKLWLFYLYWS